jgi:prefoldin subunit 5
MQSEKTYIVWVGLGFAIFSDLEEATKYAKAYKRDDDVNYVKVIEL